MVRSATRNATSKALDVATLIACAAPAGSAEPMSSIGLPIMLPRRAARLGCSSAATALRSAIKSRSVMAAGSITCCAPCGISEPPFNGTKWAGIWFPLYRNRGGLYAD